MLDTGTDIIRRASAEEIVGKRNQALALYAEGLEKLAEAAQMERAAAHRSYDSLGALGRVNMYSIDTPKNRASMVEQIRRQLDAAVWHHLIGSAGLTNYMDATATAAFRQQLANDPPPVDMETLRATFERLFQDRGVTFRRGVVEVFRKLDRDYRTNSAFRVRDRAVLSSILDHCGFSHWRQGREQIADLDRVFHMVDGKQPKDHTGDAAASINAAWNYTKKLPKVDTEYFEFKLFKNGNVHVRFKRLDLVSEVNRIIAQHYGETLADDQNVTQRGAA